VSLLNIIHTIHKFIFAIEIFVEFLIKTALHLMAWFSLLLFYHNTTGDFFKYSGCNIINPKEFKIYKKPASVYTSGLFATLKALLQTTD
tara:strand:- start:230 stop:496 length:267 start_codon:yes stop_codon:yes gene_type:complete